MTPKNGDIGSDGKLGYMRHLSAVTDTTGEWKFWKFGKSGSFRVSKESPECGGYGKVVHFALGPIFSEKSRARYRAKIKVFRVDKVRLGLRCAPKRKPSTA